MQILRVDSSGRGETSASRFLTEFMIKKLALANDESVESIDIDCTGLPHVTDAMIGAFYKPQSEQSKGEQDALALSNSLANYMVEADALVIGAPMYNFGVSGALKTFFDLVIRHNITFADGRVGLLKGKKAYVIITTGGVEIGSDMDFASGHIRTMLGYMGITDVMIIAAEKVKGNSESDAGVKAAMEQIAAL